MPFSAFDRVCPSELFWTVEKRDYKVLTCVA